MIKVSTVKLSKPGRVGRNYLGPPPAGCGLVWYYWPWQCQRIGQAWTWQSGWWRGPGSVCLWTEFEPFLNRPADRKAATPCSGKQAPTPPDAASHNNTSQNTYRFRFKLYFLLTYWLELQVQRIWLHSHQWRGGCFLLSYIQLSVHLVVISIVFLVYKMTENSNKCKYCA